MVNIGSKQFSQIIEALAESDLVCDVGPLEITVRGKNMLSYAYGKDSGAKPVVSETVLIR